MALYATANRNGLRSGIQKTDMAPLSIKSDWRHLRDFGAARFAGGCVLCTRFGEAIPSAGACPPPILSMSKDGGGDWLSRMIMPFATGGGATSETPQFVRRENQRKSSACAESQERPDKEEASIRLYQCGTDSGPLHVDDWDDQSKR